MSPAARQEEGLGEAMVGAVFRASWAWRIELAMVAFVMFIVGGIYDSAGSPWHIGAAVGIVVFVGSVPAVRHWLAGVLRRSRARRRWLAAVRRLNIPSFQERLPVVSRVREVAAGHQLGDTKEIVDAVKLWLLDGKLVTRDASDTILGAGWATVGCSDAEIDAGLRGVGYLLHAMIDYLCWPARPTRPPPMGAGSSRRPAPAGVPIPSASPGRRPGSGRVESYGSRSWSVGSRTARSAMSPVTTAWRRRRAQITTDASTTSLVPGRPHSTPTARAVGSSRGTTSTTSSRRNRASRAWRGVPRQA